MKGIREQWYFVPLFRAAYLGTAAAAALVACLPVLAAKWATMPRH
jgi:hypothetical protein